MLIFFFIFQGEQILDLTKTHLNLPFVINFYNLTQVRQPNGPIRNIRRIQQAPYPLVKVLTIQQPNMPSTSQNQRKQQIISSSISSSSAASSASSSSSSSSSTASSSMEKIQNLPTVPPKPSHMKGKVTETNVGVNVKQQRPIKSNKSGETTGPANLARQILNNLNIFSNKPGQSSSSSSSTVNMTANQHQPPPTPQRNNPNQRSGSEYHRSRSRTRADSLLDADSSSTKSGRRPSVDTVSTYLSHESKDSNRSTNIGSVSDLLDCSIGSDEVFSSNQNIPGSIVGVDSASDMISRFVRVVDPPKWPHAQPCPMCLEELRYNSQNPAIALSRCQHLMHLQCLNDLINSQHNSKQMVS